MEQNGKTYFRGWNGVAILCQVKYFWQALMFLLSMSAQCQAFSFGALLLHLLMLLHGIRALGSHRIVLQDLPPLVFSVHCRASKIWSAIFFQGYVFLWDRVSLFLLDLCISLETAKKPEEGVGYLAMLYYHAWVSAQRLLHYPVGRMHFGCGSSSYGFRSILFVLSLHLGITMYGI